MSENKQYENEYKVQAVKLAKKSGCKCNKRTSNRGRRSENHTIEALKTMIWRYFMSYWSNRRICSAIGGIPPAVKRHRFYSALTIAA